MIWKNKLVVDEIEIFIDISYIKKLTSQVINILKLKMQGL